MSRAPHVIGRCVSAILGTAAAAVLVLLFAMYWGP